MMLRFASLLALAGVGVLVPFTPAAEPPAVEKQLPVQAAMADARKCLDANMPVEAVAALEKELANADGHKPFLTLLREAYLAELYQLEKTPTVEPDRLARTRRKLLLLGGTPPTQPTAAMPPATLPEPDLGPSLVAPMPPAAAPTAPDAVAEFKRGDYAAADRLFAQTGATKLTASQKTAWAYCRIKLAADRVNDPACDATTAASVVQDVTDALQLIPQNAELQKVGQAVVKAARAKAGTAQAQPVVTGEMIETASFRVRHGGNRELGNVVAKAAEASRKQIFTRWSGPPGGAWQPKCEIVIHATAAAYAKATGKPAALTGHASVRITGGRVAGRRIDLRADDTAAVSNALPRELTHVILADMFPTTPPPKWALEGMAILAGSPEEISRYTRTLTRCARDGELRPLATLFGLKDFPADKITGFYCQSVSVTEYLIKLNGERNFKIFLSDVQRYGTAAALKRQYGIDGPQALEGAWKRASVDPVRGQGP